MINTIQETKDFLTRLWHLENKERPGFVLGYLGPKVRGGMVVRSALFSTEGMDTIRDRLLKSERYLQAQLEEIEDQLKLKGDFVPSLCPSLGVIAIASAFGCEVVWWEKDFPAVKPIIKEGVEEVPDFFKPNPTAGELGRILDYTRYFIDKTGGKYPIRLTDIQGPLDNVAIIMGHNNLLTAMLSKPKSVHHLMGLVTDLMIDFIKAQREIVYQAGIEFVPAMFLPWIPDGLGVAVSNDDWVMISPEMHDEFHIPYLNRLSEEFGGIYLHSCGNWQHQIPSIKKIYQLRGLEFGASETPPEAVFEAFNGKLVLACRVGFNRDYPFTGMTNFVRRILKARKTNRGLFINIDVTNGQTDHNWPETDIGEIYQLLGVK